ncbi:MAG: hypothetical protein ACUVR0_03665 [Candidatus Aminicenantales bacterium]
MKTRKSRFFLPVRIVVDNERAFIELVERRLAAHGFVVVNTCPPPKECEYPSPRKKFRKSFKEGD